MQVKMTKILRKYVIVGILHTFLFAPFVFSASNDTLYMLPYEQKQAINALQGALSNAKNEIKISIYSFTNNDIAKILRDVAKRGVKVEIIFDKESNVDNRSSVIGYLAKYNNISVCLLSGVKARNGKYYGIMHQKMVIIDDEILALGSANWSKNAFENNFETLLFTSQTHLVQKASNAFEKMKQNCLGF
nr:phospholipase D-like domain-containing protein [uncultured Helicobacter sp.]